MPLYQPQGTPVIADASLTIAKTNGLQTALDSKAASNSATFTGTVTIPDGALAIADTSGLQTALDGKPDSSTVDTITVLTQAAYDAIGTKVSTTLYVIVG